MKRLIFVFLFSLSVTFFTQADSHEKEDDYVGGLGLLSVEGPTGLFLNPTSGIQPKGKLITQYCLAAIVPEGADNHVVGHNFNVAYGALDWLEAGFVGKIVETDGSNNLDAYGGQIRARVLKDYDWYPEASVGFYFYEGDDGVTSRDIYVAFSKHLDLHDGDYFNLVRGHAGFRYKWAEVGDDSVRGYFGGEVRIMEAVYFVGEVSTKDSDVDAHVPYSFGFQIRYPNGFGFSLAGIQTGGLDQIGVFVGVGISFF